MNNKHHLYGTTKDGTDLDLGFAYGTKAHVRSRLSALRVEKNLARGEGWACTTNPQGCVNEAQAVVMEWK